MLVHGDRRAAWPVMLHAKGLIGIFSWFKRSHERAGRAEWVQQGVIVLWHAGTAGDGSDAARREVV
jgi:hypothetical protein